MKLRSLFLWLISTHLSFVCFAQPGFGEAIKINEGWVFTLGDIEDAFQPLYDIKNWKKIELPHDWSVKEQLSPTLASCSGYLPGGIGWYRKTIEVPENRKGEKLYLYFEGVYNRSHVYINGKLLGHRPNGYISFMYDATPYIKYNEENIIAVKVDHSKAADSRWYTGSGIYRDVWLVYANPVHIAQWGVYAYPTLNKNNGQLNVEIETINDSEVTTNIVVENTLISNKGKTVASNKQNVSIQRGQSKIIKTVLNVSNPLLWDLLNPNLYKLETKLKKNGKEIDATITHTGFRSFTFNPNKGFALNGKWMKMKGVCLHHDAGVLGAAVPKNVLKRRLITLKQIGVNAIRTSHNPQATALYDLCDELGLLVMNEAFDEWEFPKRKWIQGWNVGTPGFQGSYDFFKEWGERDLGDMVKRDRNHLSVFAWSIGNEVDYPNDPYSHPILNGSTESGFTQKIFGGYKKDAPDAMQLGDIAKKLVAVVKKYDKSRATTAGLAGVAMSNETEYPGALDIAGYNYTESRYVSDHQKYPNRVIYGSENRHDFDAWKAVINNEYIFGQFLWTGIDYLGESGRWPSRGFYSGLMDFAGFIKPRGYFRQSLWSDKPMAYLGTYPAPGSRGIYNNSTQDVLSQSEGVRERAVSIDAWPVWNYDEGRLIRVVCYTNAAQARLLLNDNEIGARKSYDNSTGIIYWDVPFKPGKLEAECLNADGSVASRYSIHSSGRPYAIRVTPIDTEIKKGEISHILIEIIDEQNNPVILADNEITFRIEGPARLLGLEAGNNTDMSDYTDNRHRVYHGKMIAYIKVSDKDLGNVIVNVSSPLLKKGTTEIAVK